MDTSLSFIPVNPVSPGATDSTGSALAAVPSAVGEEFSALLTGQMLKAERQLFAAQTLPGTGLQVLPLGNKIKLITSDGPLPDMASLAAFARTQGIDESAVQALFAPPRGKSQSTELAEIMSADPFNPGNPVWQIPLDVTSTAPAPVTPVTPVTPVATMATMATMATVSTLSPMLGSRNIAGWMPLKVSVLMDASEVTNPGDVSSQAAIQDAMRVTITSPAQAVTQRSTQMSGSPEQSTWAALLAGTKATFTTLAAANAWETLQLDVSDELLQVSFEAAQNLLVDNPIASNSQGMGHATTGTSPGQSAPAVSAAPNLSSQAEQRVIQQQQLADKLGQALAQRLVDQIERGQWKVEMRLQPESLGRIEVELKMHAGGLDALFSAENAMTRELISQGSGKLKDALTQTGMTVADVSVNGEQSRQSGGNSTPGNSYKPASGVAGRKPSGVEGVAATVRDQPAETDGLNVWA